MSRSRRLRREDFHAGMFAALDQGRFDITLRELCSDLGVTTGSFYSHYGELPELHREVTEIWLRASLAALDDAPGDGVRDPLDSLRMAQAAAGRADGRAATMRRWGAMVSTSDSAWVQSVPVVAAAVARLDEKIVDYLTGAITDLGFTGREPAALAGWLAAALQVQARARDREGLETILDVWARAAAFNPEAPAGMRDAAAPDAMRLYTTARALPQRARQALQQVAEQLYDAHTAEPQPQDHDQEAARQAR